MMSKNTKPTHMNAEPKKSDDLHKVCHYENSKVSMEENKHEQTRDQVYESMNLEPTNVYEHIHQQHHHDEHPYADLSAL